MLKKYKQNIKHWLSVFMLMVFAIVLTPWNVIHSHQQIPIAVKEVNCKHLSHVQAHAENCLICNASFEKDYVHSAYLYKIYLSVKIFGRTEETLKSFYTEIKRTSLRGPPVA